MRKVRNLVFALLCLVTYMTPAPVSAVSDCWADYAYTDQDGGDHYQGLCDNCSSEEPWYAAIVHCATLNRVMVEYFCAEYLYEYVCLDPLPN